MFSVQLTYIIMKAVQNTLDLPVFGVFFPQAILRFRFVRVSPSSPTIITRTFNATPQAAQKQYKSSEAIRFVPKLRRTRLVFMILDFRRKKKEKNKTKRNKWWTCSAET